MVQRTSPALATRVAEQLFTTARRHARPDWERALLATALPSSLRLPGGRIPAWSWGAVGAPVVLLVHGWEGRGTQMGGFVAPLVARGYRVVAFDAPGHGDAAARRASVFDHAEAVAAALDRFERTVGVVAHSFGGFATTVALAHVAPEHARRSLRLAYVASPVDPSGYMRGFSRVLGIRDDVGARLVRRLEARFGVAFADLDGRRLAARVRSPLLLIHDDGDDEVPLVSSEALAGAWPGARLVVTHGLGHRRVLKAPEVHAAVGAFLDEGGPAGLVAGTLDAELWDPELRRAMAS